MILSSIPVVDARGRDAAFTAAQLPNQVSDILRTARGAYTGAGLALGDAISRRWLARNETPYRAELAALAASLGRSGSHLLNVSYEWGCTTGIVPSRDGGQTLVRVLDWDLERLGRNLAAIRQAGGAGEWINVGSPGFSGAITAMAPGRFAAAINQPPIPPSRLGAAAARISPTLRLVCDWGAARPAIWRSRAMPPAHLLRLIMDEARDWREAVSMLSDTPISAAAFFAVSGVRAGEACVVERLPTAGRVRQGEPAVSVANHWAAFDLAGRSQVGGSAQRKAQMERSLTDEPDPFSMAWLRPPILNPGTRVVAVVNATSGRLALRGGETSGPVTETLHLR